MRTRTNTPAKLAKTAITVPAKVLAAVDQAARERGQSRSSFISAVLAQAVKARRDAEITRRLNVLFADEALANEELRTVHELTRGTVDWSEEGW